MVRPSLLTLLLIGLLVLPACRVRSRRAPASQPARNVAAEPTSDAAIEVVEPVVADPAPSWAPTTTIGAVVAARPRTARLFELVGVDYCCGGKQTLAAAAEEKGLDTARLIEALLAMSGTAPESGERDWRKAPLGELMDHIIDTHHAFLRRELPRLTGLVATVTRVHGEAHPELIEVKQLYAALRKDIGPHLESEETMVFPAIRALPATKAADVEKLLEGMRTEHDHVGGLLHRLRELTDGYKHPEDACVLYGQMLDGLAALERDLHTHVHIENEVLLPRALEAAKGS